MQESQFVFAYGSNMDPDQMRERCPESDLSWFVARAKGFELFFPRTSEKRKGGVGSIRPTSQSESAVWGVVFAVTRRDLTRLDRFEGVRGESYRRDLIKVHDRQGQQHAVWTYFAVPQTPRRNYKPHEDYIQLYLKGAEYFGLPSDYVAYLRRIKTKKAKRARPARKERKRAAER